MRTPTAFECAQSILGVEQFPREGSVSAVGGRALIARDMSGWWV